jgi:hypothetical protein
MVQTGMHRRTARWAFLVVAILLAGNFSDSIPAEPRPFGRQDPAPAAQQQSGQPSPPPPTAPSATPAPPSPHAVRAHSLKIWTNEDLIGTRTPADIYLFAKEAKAAADQAAAVQAITSCFAPNQSEASPEDTLKSIEETTQSIQEAEKGIVQAKRQVAEDPEGLRTRDQAELNRRTAERNRLLEQLHTLQDRLQQVTPKPASDEAATPSGSPPQE